MWVWYVTCMDKIRGAQHISHKLSFHYFDLLCDWKLKVPLIALSFFCVKSVQP
jgi:hypothetical protein